MHRLPPLLTALLLLCGALPGQAVPAAASSREGDTSFHALQYNPARVQTVYGSALLPGARSLKGIRLRRDAAALGPVTAHVYEHTLRLSNRATDPVTGYGIRWAANHGQDLVVAMGRRKITWPATPAPAAPPAPFTVDLPLDKPFAYLGKALVVDLETHEDGTSLYRHPWPVDADTATGTWTFDPGTFRAGGRGCPWNPTVPGTSFEMLGYLPHLNGPFHLYADHGAGPAGRPAVCLLGTSVTAWGATPLPLDLTGLGAPGCALLVEPAVLTPGRTGPGPGQVAFDMGTVPGLPALVALAVHTQAVVLDPAHNALGIRTSDYVKWTVGKGLQGAVQAFTFYAYTYPPRGDQVDPDFCSFVHPYAPILELY